MHPSRDPTAPSDGSARPVCYCSSSSVSVDCLRREMTKDGNSWPDEAGCCCCCCCCPGCFTWPGHKRSVERGKPAGSVAGSTSISSTLTQHFYALVGHAVPCRAVSSAVHWKCSRCRLSYTGMLCTEAFIVVCHRLTDSYQAVLVKV